MVALVPFIEQIIPPLVIVGQIIIAVLILILIINRVQKKQNILTEIINDNALWLAFLVALASTVGSLFYSDILGYEPCKLCWYQRILIYPQVILLGMAAWKKDNNIIDYAIVFSVLGIALSGLQYYQQMVDPTVLACGFDAAESCSKKFILDYGYITIPIMALTSFVLMFLLLISKKVYNNKS